jgi:hypothetical protein
MQATGVGGARPGQPCCWAGGSQTRLLLVADWLLYLGAATRCPDRQARPFQVGPLLPMPRLPCHPGVPRPKPQPRPRWANPRPPSSRDTTALASTPARSWATARIDGGTGVDERQSVVDGFNQRGVGRVFLLSTRAGEGRVGVRVVRARTRCACVPVLLCVCDSYYCLRMCVCLCVLQWECVCRTCQTALTNPSNSASRCSHGQRRTQERAAPSGTCSAADAAVGISPPPLARPPLHWPRCAGGAGLNLVGANHLVLFDRWGAGRGGV